GKRSCQLPQRQSQVRSRRRTHRCQCDFGEYQLTATQTSLLRLSPSISEHTMNKFYIQKTVHLCICVASIFSVNYAAHAATKIDPRAQQLLKHSLDTYRSLQSFQNTVVKSSTSPAGKEVTRQVISWKAPRYLNVVTISGRERLIDNYDGTHYNYTHFDTTG